MLAAGMEVSLRVSVPKGVEWGWEYVLPVVRTL